MTSVPRKPSLRTRRLVVYAAFLLMLGAAFLYGFASAHYRWFPYYQLAFARAWTSGALTSGDVFREGGAGSVAMRETHLHRIFLKQVYLPGGVEDFNGGGALALAGDVLFAITRQGEVRAFDLLTPTPLVSNVPSAPINVDELARSRLRFTIWLPWFRVSGAYAVEEADGSYTLFVSHNIYHSGDGCISFNVSRVNVIFTGEGVLSQGDWRTIFTADPCLTPDWTLEGPGIHPFSGHISGGRMTSYDDQRLLLTVGDFTYDGNLREPVAQDLTSPFGKVLLIDRETGSHEVYASGLRNNMGIFHDKEGKVWVTESGPQGGDELNLIERGKDFGWPVETYGLGYETTPWPLAAEQGRHERFQLPRFAWIPSIAPTAVVRMDAPTPQFPLWEGDLLVASLRGQALHRLRLEEGSRVVYEEVIPMNERIRDLVRLRDGSLLLLTDASGSLIFLGDGGPSYDPLSEQLMQRMEWMERFGALVGEEDRSLELAGGEAVFSWGCAACHAVEPTNLFGPHLAGIVGRPVGSVESFNYSSVLERSDESWTTDHLRKFLLTPDSLYPNSRMPRILLTEQQADSVVAYLQRLAER